jgi:mannosyltransferase OCH1-like enzyme
MQKNHNLLWIREKSSNICVGKCSPHFPDCLLGSLPDLVRAFFGDNVIPKKLHIVWVGDESKRPDNCINTWRTHNPDWDIKVWGNADLANNAWRNARHMQDMWKHELCGVADLMRYEILYEHGGFAVDADSVCLKPLPDWLLEADEFTCWESEHERLGLLAIGYLAAQQASPFIGQIIEDIYADKTVVDRPAWQSTGPARLTEIWQRFKYGLTIYPSHYFIPRHFAGAEYKGTGHVFAKQFWGSTHGIYDSLYMSEAIDERE